MPARKKKNPTLLGWLGRQIGHVRRAVKTDVTKPQPKVVARKGKVEEAAHPTEPGVKLRRTTIDEVIVDPKKRIS